jgi:hypothetical protein
MTTILSAGFGSAWAQPNPAQNKHVHAPLSIRFGALDLAGLRRFWPRPLHQRITSQGHGAAGHNLPSDRSHPDIQSGHGGSTGAVATTAQSV